MKPVKIYVAGKMSKSVEFATYTWRDDFIKKLAGLTGLTFISYDPTNTTKNYSRPELVFGSDAHMISMIDVLVAYLTDDVSIGTSQEILIAKYFKKPVIALAPLGGKFNLASKEIGGEIIKDYKHPFVYATCDKVCESIEEVAEALSNLDNLKPKSINVIKELSDEFRVEHSVAPLYKIKTIK